MEGNIFQMIGCLMSVKLIFWKSYICFFSFQCFALECNHIWQIVVKRFKWNGYVVYEFHGGPWELEKTANKNGTKVPSLG